MQKKIYWQNSHQELREVDISLWLHQSFYYIFEFWCQSWSFPDRKKSLLKKNPSKHIIFSKGTTIANAQNEHTNKLKEYRSKQTPRKSDVSEYWWQFKMCNFEPNIVFNNWQTVVFPPPVSPTSNTGSRNS